MSHIDDQNSCWVFLIDDDFVDINWWHKIKNIFSHNNIRFIESDTFEWGPEKLEILHLDHNYMEVIEQDLFSGKVSFSAESTVKFTLHTTRSNNLQKRWIRSISSETGLSRMTTGRVWCGLNCSLSSRVK